MSQGGTTTTPGQGGATTTTSQGGSTDTRGQGGSTTGSGQGGAPNTIGGATSTPGCGTKNSNPFNCKFAWGAPSNGSNHSYLNFVSTWIGDEPNGGLDAWSPTATNSGQASQNACGDCALVKSIATTNSMVVFYTYFIGFQACKQGGFCDCNTDFDGKNLCTDGAQWIRDNRATLVRAYGQYAKAVYANSPNRPTIWWLEGDFVQYTEGGATTQLNRLTYAEAGQLTREIVCAIKSNQPNAIVAMNHSPWNGDAVSQGFWAAQPKDVLDLVWVQGPGDSDVFINSGDYNKTTANYKWLHGFTGLPILAETSYANSGADDHWTTTTTANIDARITNGVIGVLVNNPSSNYQAAIGNFSGLGSTCP